MAISSFPANGGADYSTTYYVPGSANVQKITFSNLRAGSYGPFRITGQASVTLNSNTIFNNGAKLDSYNNNPWFNLGANHAYMESSTGTGHYTIYPNLDLTDVSTGNAYVNNSAFHIATDNTTIVIPLYTYRPVIGAWGNQTYFDNNNVSARDRLVLGNTIVAYRDGSFPLDVNTSYPSIHYVGTNTTTFSTTTIIPTSITPFIGISGSGNFGKIRYEASLTNKWVAVGHAGAGTGNPAIASSTDGVTWTTRTVPGTWVTNQTPARNRIHAVTFSNSVWAASGIVVTTTTPAVAVAARVWTSTDSVTWTQTYTTTVADSSYGFVDIVGINSISEKFALRSASDSSIYTSTDATTWTLRSTAVPANSTPVRLSVANGRYYVISQDSTTTQYSVTYSTNGSTWTTGTIKYHSGQIGEVGYIGGYYYISSEPGIAVSTDGVTFETVYAGGLREFQGTTDTQSYRWLMGIELYTDGTRYAKINYNRSYAGSFDYTRVYYSTASIASFLYGTNHPELNYVYSLPTPGQYPRTLP